jgi:hypothetical protein
MKPEILSVSLSGGYQMQLAKPVRELFKNVGVNQEIFQLKEGLDLREQDKMAEQMGFTNIAKTMAAKEDEEVWLELQFYRDQKHLDDLAAKMQKDENAGKLGKQFMDLLTPCSCIEGRQHLGTRNLRASIH